MPSIYWLSKQYFNMGHYDTQLNERWSWEKLEVPCNSLNFDIFLTELKWISGMIRVGSRDVAPMKKCCRPKSPIHTSEPVLSVRLPHQNRCSQFNCHIRTGALSSTAASEQVLSAPLPHQNTYSQLDCHIITGGWLVPSLSAGFHLDSERDVISRPCIILIHTST